MKKNNKILWTKSYRPWVNITEYYDKETGLEVPAEEIPGNYIIINTEKHVTGTKTNRIAKRTITVRKQTHKQGNLF